ncbi:hypothetical protein [Sabulicella rubraurantiaca]|uniref:hypothetical protein n=1 Tax=Sabulicella rubraurantiaca TaxID=2811429 RepID=UPI001A9696E3|nr:hypothetical protein [Sabulicella rubraurantiaca]
MRQWMVAAVALALAGCGSGRLEDRLVACPQLSLPADAADLTRYRPGAPPDLSTLVLDARITAVDGNCRRGRRDRSVDATVSVRMRVDRGPAATTRTAELPWFIAVVEGDNVLSRQGFVLPVTFAPNTTRAELATPSIEIAFPVREGRRIQDLRILVGFRLSPEELALNRRRGPQ